MNMKHFIQDMINDKRCPLPPEVRKSKEKQVSSSVMAITSSGLVFLPAKLITPIETPQKIPRMIRYNWVLLPRPAGQ